MCCREILRRGKLIVFYPSTVRYTTEQHDSLWSSNLRYWLRLELGEQPNLFIQQSNPNPYPYPYSIEIVFISHLFLFIVFSFLNVNLMNDRPCKRFRPITSTRKCLPSTNWATTKSTNNGIVNLFMKYYCIIYCSFDCLTYCNLTYSTLTWLASTWFEWTDEWNWTGRQDGVVNLAFFIGGDGQTGQSQTGGCWNFSNTNRRWRENRPPQQIAIG